MFRKWQTGTRKTIRLHKNYKPSKSSMQEIPEKQEAKIAREAKASPKAFWNYVKYKTKSRTDVAEETRWDQNRNR